MININYILSPKAIIKAPSAVIKEKLNNWQIREKKTAERIVNLIPSQCPFARDIVVFKRYLFTIPPLCKINPFYEDLMMLRFRALCFLSDLGEDITCYCQ